jgi:hypothetical protein
MNSRRSLCNLILALAFATVEIAASHATTRTAKPGGEGNGYSYLRMEISGKPITNIVVDEKHQGWLQISSVRATALQSDANANASSAKPASKWTALPAILRAGRVGRGKIRFGAGDSGGLDPLIEAQKHGSPVESAELDLYDESSGKFIGKYKLKNIRVLSLEDVPASACAMYEITMSFESANKM